MISFIITLFAGLSTMIGTVFLFIRVKDENKIISRSLIFSSSIMIFISIFDLIPSSYNYFNKFYNYLFSFLLLFIYLLFGGLIVYFLDNKKRNNTLYQVGIISMIALVLHNIPEGIITFISSSKDLSIGLPLSISIALHNIPEGIVISIPIYYSCKSKKKACFYTLIAALSEPLGGIISYLFFNNINDFLFASILSITAGIMIYLTVFELIKEGIKYDKSNLILYFALGIIIMIISSILV